MLLRVEFAAVKQILGYAPRGGYLMRGLRIIAILCAFAVLAGCSGQGAGTSSRSDTFIYAQGADPRGLDPAFVDDGESAMVMANVYEGLTKYNDKTTAIEPSLATSWDVSADGLTYVFQLRQGVKFHDGSPFNAEAAKASIDRQLPPNDTSNMPYAEFTFGYVKSIEATSEYVLTIYLTQPCTPFLANLAMTLAAPIASPTAIGKSATGNLNENPVGTGPYKFVSWEKGVSVKITRNDDYWGEKAKIKNVTYQIIPENSSRSAAMMAKTIDAMSGLDAPDVAAVRDSGAQIFEADGMNINYMAFNVTREPFNDPKLREAVIRAINVEELVSSLYLGYSMTAYSVLPTFMPGYAPSVKPFAYDPEASKALLKEIGKEGLAIDIITYSNPRPYNSATGTKLAEAIQGYLAQVGITASITQYDWADYKGKVAQGEGDICFYGWIGDNGDPDNFMNLLDDKDRSMNVSGYNNPEYHDLILEAVSAPNGDARNALYGEMEAIVARDGVWLPISHARSMAAYGANVSNFFIHPTGSIFFSQITKS
jgi:peptide/nickel transport system substrate-binding protein